MMTPEHYYFCVEAVCDLLEKYLEKDGRDVDIKTIKEIRKETELKLKLWKEQ